MTNFDQGLILGLTMPWFGSAVEKKLVGYSYNGVVLPELPAVEGYPYAYIVKSTGVQTIYKLYISSALGVAKSGLTGDSINIWLGSDVAFGYNLEGSAWVCENDTPTVDQIWLVGSGVVITELIWTNTNIDYENGTRYFDASDYIPVYE